jgi:DNA-nicking Smr family endonuclease
MKIDLHGLTYKQAVLRVENELIMNQIYKENIVEIITGKSILMQNTIIREVLDKYEFKYHIPTNNTGVLIVDETSF